MIKESLSDSLEEYLETIFDIINLKKAAKAKDIATRMKVAGSSVTGALKSLKDKGLVNYEPYDLITLTSKGEKMARKVILRRDTLEKFFTAGLFIDKEKALESANKMKHQVPPIVVERMLQFLKFIGTHPDYRPIWTDDNEFVPMNDLK